LSITVILTNFASQVRTRGILSALQSLFRRARIRFEEWRFGIYTDTTIEPMELGIHNVESKHYGATDYASIHKIMRALEIDPSAHVFLDFGAGMGRAMILAARYPFRKVLGVEIAGELTRIAEQNFKRCRSRLRCRNPQIVTCDATKYQIPPDVSVVYFNNPFFGKILAAVLDNLRASLVATPRELHVVCNLPQQSAFEEQITMCGWLRLRKRLTLPHDRRCLIYTVVGPWLT
jgi:16S rRNA G966 N2-methylase RsmD